jgi:regulator of replication initiation timing
MNRPRRGACGGLTKRLERSQPPARASAASELRLASRFGLLSDILYEVNSSMPIEQRLTDSLAECDRLQEENRQLRERLGPPQTGTTIQPVLTRSGNIASATINSKSSQEEKVKLFRDLFRGRDDVYAVRWEGRNGKTGYSPAYRRIWGIHAQKNRDEPKE